MVIAGRCPTRARGDLSGPARDERHAHAALERRALALAERPGEPAWLPYDSHGPLSEVKITSVLSSRFARLSGVEDLADRPVDLLDHVAVQAAAGLALESSDTNSGTCGIVCGTYRKNGVSLFRSMNRTARSV